MYIVVDGRQVCPVCGFEWDAIAPEVVARRVTAASAAIAAVVSSDPEGTRRRPAPQRWSTFEYAAHVRDVLMAIRDRLVLTAVEDNPSPPLLHREERVDLGLYEAETSAGVATSLVVMADLFARTFDTLHPRFYARTLIYSQLLQDVRTMAWTGAQAVHECEHHLADIHENAELLGA